MTKTYLTPEFSEKLLAVLELFLSLHEADIAWNKLINDNVSKDDLMEYLKNPDKYELTNS